ncbi:MAG: hypothetical protein IJX44_08790 [Bacteroidaceae bacterium]|nr:hypothetical protein [Bacteroidaceae bacterium]
MKKIILFALVSISVFQNSYSQSYERIKNHNLIFNCDIASGNPYTIAASSILTGLTNYYILNDAFFENSFAYGIYSTDTDNLKVKTLNPMGITARELFNNMQVGLKLGYQTYSPEFFNFGLYSSAHYKVEQFEVGYNDDNMDYHRAQRMLFGATALFSFGNMGQASRVIVEAGCRYSMRLGYTSPLGEEKKQLNNGLVSHYAVKFASRGLWQNIGIYADINHFDLWNDSYRDSKLKNVTIGITWTITPQQADSRRDE